MHDLPVVRKSKIVEHVVEYLCIMNLRRYKKVHNILSQWYIYHNSGGSGISQD